MFFKEAIVILYFMSCFCRNTPAYLYVKETGKQKVLKTTQHQKSVTYIGSILMLKGHSLYQFKHQELEEINN